MPSARRAAGFVASLLGAVAIPALALAQADLTIDKRHTADFAVGQQGVYRFVVKNVGSAPIVATASRPVTVRDTLPLGLTFFDDQPSNWVVGSLGPQRVTATLATGVIAPGDSSVFGIIVDVLPAAVPAVVNSATVSAPGDSVNQTNNRDVDSTKVTWTPDLKLVKSHDAPFTVGLQGVYTLTLTNSGNGPTEGAITLRDSLPDGLTFVSGAPASWSFSTAGPIVTATSPDTIDLADTVRVTLTVDVLAAAAPAVTNIATVTGGRDVSPGNNTASDFTPIDGYPDLALTKSHTGPFLVNQQDSYDFAVANVGTVTAAGPTTVRDTLPAGLAFVSGAGAGWTIGEGPPGIVTATFAGSVPPLGTAPFTVTVAVSPAAIPSVINYATVENAGDLQPANDRDRDSTAITSSADLSLRKTHALPFKVGVDGVYTLAVRNLDPLLSTSGTVTVVDTLPPGVVFRSGAGAGWTINGTPTDSIVTATLQGGIPPLDSAVVTLTVTPAPLAFPQVVNRAMVRTLGDPDSTNNRALDPTDVAGAPDLGVDKRHTANFVLGLNGTYTLVVTNLGTDVTTDSVTVQDALPPGFSFVSGSGTNWIVNADSLTQQITAKYGLPIAVADSAKFTLTVVTAAPAVTGKTNRAMVSTPGDPNPANDIDADSTIVSTPDVSIDKSHIGNFTVGLNASFTISVRNLSNGINPLATRGPITVTDVLPPGLTFVPAGSGGGAFTLTADPTGQVVTATRNSVLGIGGVATFTMRVAVGSAAFPSVNNTATVSTVGDVTPANNSSSNTATVVRTQPDLVVDKRHVAPFFRGQNGQYRIVVTNVGFGPTTGTITVSDTLPPALTYLSATGTGLTVSPPPGPIVTATTSNALAVGDSVALDLTVSAAAPSDTTVINFASVATTGIDVDSTNNRDPDPTLLQTPAGGPDLSIDKRHTGLFPINQTGDYTIVVKNVGNAPSAGTITVQDTLPTGLGYASHLGVGWSITASPGNPIISATYIGGNLAPLDSAKFSITVAVAGNAPSSVTNVAGVSGGGDVSAANNRDSDVTAIAGGPDLTLDKRHVDPFVVGQDAIYTIVVTNLGNQPTTGTVTVRDTLRTGLTFVDDLNPGAWVVGSLGPSRVTANLTLPIAPGDSSSFSIIVHVGDQAAPAVINAATVSGGGDTSPANNRDVDFTDVLGFPDLTVDKRHTVGFAVGQPGTYTVVVANVGTGPTTAPIGVRDSLPAGLTFVSGAGAGWSFSSAGPIVTAQFAGPIALRDSSKLTLTVAVAAAATPSVTNSIEVSAGGDTNLVNNRDSDVTEVSGIADLIIDKRHLGTFRLGDSGTYQFVITNIGSATTFGTVTVRDTLPPGLTYLFGGASTWSMAASGQIVTAINFAPIARGDSSVVTMTVAIGQAALPAVTNSATVTGGGDVTPANNRDTDQVSITGHGELAASIRALQTEVDVGEVIDYVMIVKNVGDGPVTGVEAAATLPQGVRYRGGSSRVNRAHAADPAGAPGPTLRFPLGTVSSGAEVAVTYRVEAGAGSEVGTGVTSVSATGHDPASGQAVASNAASSAVHVSPGVFGDEGIITGKVTVDANGDVGDAQGAGDVGVPGVRLYLEDGSSAITDSEGKYSFNHLGPRLHVVRVDETTLPAGAHLVPTSNRNAGDGRSQFVDLKRGELHRADFVEASRAPAVLEAVKLRRGASEVSEDMLGGGGASDALGAAGRDSLGAAGRDSLGVAGRDSLGAAGGDSLGVAGGDSLGAAGRDSLGVTGGHAAARSGPPARPRLLAFGLVNARLDWHGSTKSELGGAGHDRFEDRLRDIGSGSDDGTFEAGARAALFVNGNVSDSVHVLFRYDSERQAQRRMFSDIRPDDGYVMMGDASVHGFDTQSAGRLFARAERGGSYAMYGDFATPAEPVRELGAFSRRLNGGLASIALGPTQWQGFAAQGHQRQVIDEFPAQGISGPFTLSHPNGTLGSELVEVVVRDRDQPALILSRSAQVRFLDYTLEPFTGRLLFRRPIASIDKDLNPISIRVTYETDTDGYAYWVAGGVGRAAPLPQLTLGGSVARDQDPLSPRSVVSGDATYRIGTVATLTGEVAQTDSGGAFLSGDKLGHAGRAEARVEYGKLKAKLYALRTGLGYDNPSSGLVAGREEQGFDLHSGLAREGAALFATGIHTRDLRTTGERDGVDVGLSQHYPIGLTFEAAWRWSHEGEIPASPTGPGENPITSNTIRGKLTTPMPWVKASTMYGEVEQDATWYNRHRFAGGTDLRITDKTRMFGRYENIASFDGPFALNDYQQKEYTVVGIESDEVRDAHIYSEYRLRDAAAGREAQAAMGLRNRFVLRPGVVADAGFERVIAVRGATDGASTAFTTALEYTASPTWKGTARGEWRRLNGDDQWLSGAGLEYKLSRTWAMLGRTELLRRIGLDRSDSRSQLGFAYRSTDTNHLNALARYDNKIENQHGALGFRRVSHIVSSHANWQPKTKLTLGGQLASQWKADDHDSLLSRTHINLVAGRALYDLTPKLDIGGLGRTEFGGGMRFGVGAELGWLAARNLRVAAGYNVFGFHDADMTSGDRTDPGPYLDLGYKFDPFWGGR